MGSEADQEKSKTRVRLSASAKYVAVCAKVVDRKLTNNLHSKAVATAPPL